MSPYVDPLGLYLHLPFCPVRCPYCDFYALPYAPGPARGLLEALGRHLETLAPQAAGRRLDTVYFGGGTPSMWPAATLAGLLAALDRTIGLAPEAEISLEANPGTLSAGKLAALARAGFNRLSLGAQSFHAPTLALLGRRHSPDDTRRAVRQARRAGFANLSLDLIYGLPRQTAALAAADLAAALELAPDHLSLYELTLGAGTVFGRSFTAGRPPLPSEDDLTGMEARAAGLLATGGLERYEVSNYARPGYRCRHNADTWAGGDYLALGPGAHGHLAGVRWAWTADAGAYAAALAAGREPLAFREALSPRQRALELFMLGLRTTDGVDLVRVGRVLGRPARLAYAGPLAEIAARGWAILTDERLRPTEAGLAMADAAAGLFA